MDAEEYINNHRPNEGVTAGSAEVVIDDVEEVAEPPEEEEDRNMQERMYPAHEPHHMGIFKASK